MPRARRGGACFSSARRAGYGLGRVGGQYKNRAASKFDAAHIPEIPEIIPEIPDIPDSKAIEKNGNKKMGA